MPKRRGSTCAECVGVLERMWCIRLNFIKANSESSLELIRIFIKWICTIIKARRLLQRNRTNSRILCRDERILDKCELIHRRLLEKLSTKMELSKYCNGRFFSPQRLQRKIMSPVNMNRALRSPKAHKFQATKYLPELSIQSI
ncbi:unnamed protein product [Moneuplotes crassus]|uniref:Uncharacterized protein n=1 Tax=Euplotes crassus TaxID=5936 RepID=A0AAD2D5E4_EUPCR|nr:unnamed protein product [Moneuplotes crassus]